MIKDFNQFNCPYISISDFVSWQSQICKLDSWDIAEKMPEYKIRHYHLNKSKTFNPLTK